MDDKKIQEILNDIEIPEPPVMAQEKAVQSAMMAYSEKNKNNFKGNDNTARPISNSNLFRRNIMKKIFALSGTVAVCALLAVGFGVFNNNPVGTSTVALYQSPTEKFVSNINNFADDLLNKVEDNIVVASADSTKSNNQFSVVASNVMGSSNINSDMDKGFSAKVPAIKEQVELTQSSNAPNAYNKAKRERKDFVGNVAAGDMALMSAPKPQQAFKSITNRAIPSNIQIQPIDVVKNDRQYIGQDEFENIEDNNIKIVKKEPVSTLSVDVDTASYSFVRRMLNQGILPQKNAVRVEELINYFDYDYKVPNDASKPFEPTVAVYDSPWNENNKLIHIGIKGHDIDKSEKPKTNLVFLIDSSGSMNSQDKLPLLKKSLSMLVNTLTEEDTVSIVAYAGSAGTVLEPTSAKDKNKIISAMDKLRSGGSTSGGAGIKLAYNLAQQNFDKDGVNRVILATDGDFNVGITNHNELQDFIERKRDTGIFLSVLGFGQGNYHDNLMQKLAQNGNGNASYIDSLNEARKVLVDEASSTLFTIAKDVKIQVEFNQDMVSEYRLIGYETRALKREDFNNDKIDAAEIGAGHSVTAIYEITPANSKGMIDDLRYQETDSLESKDKINQNSEYAYLKIRYKLPKEDVSQLITRPITASDLKTFDNLSDDIKFAASVAAFGQKLRGGKYIGKFKYDDIINLAKSGKGEDDFGYRSEFINLVRTAKAISVPEEVDMDNSNEDKNSKNSPSKMPMAPLPTNEYHDSKTQTEHIKRLEQELEKKDLEINREQKINTDSIPNPDESNIIDKE